MNVIFTKEQEENLLRWAQELETTNFAQGRGGLCKVFFDEPSTKEGEHRAYCCLGIYGSMAKNISWELEVYWGLEDGKPSSENYFSLMIDEQGYSANLPPQFQEELGLNKILDEDSTAKLHEAFVDLNDYSRYSFGEIAQEIRHLVATGQFTEKAMKDLRIESLKEMK